MPTEVEIKEKLEKVFKKEQADVLAEVIVEEYNKLVRASDFNELKEIVKELAEAQKRTEIKVEELAEAQKKTETRLTRLEVVVEELAEAQKRTEIKVEELAEAQKRTEIKVEELAEAQKRTEIKVEELAEAQKKTEEELQKLIHEHRETRRQLGGLSITVGYTLENEAYKALPKLLKKDFGLTVKEKLKRKFVTDNRGKSIEINIIGQASRNAKKVMIIGEGKSQLSKNDVNDFLKKKLNRLEGVFDNIFPVLVTHMTTAPDVEEYAKEKGIALFYSYDF
jgi:chromosome segregation ATPase